MSVSDDVDRLQRVQELEAAPDGPTDPPTIGWVRDRRSGTVTLYEAACDRPDVVGCWITVDEEYAYEVGT